MNISWFGQSCFRIEAKEGSILIDPFSKEIGLRSPKIKDNIVLVSHHHYDHDNIGEANPEAFLIDGPGEYEKQGISIRGIQSFHDKSGGKERGLNTMYVIKVEDVTICHMGDFGQDKFEEHQLEEIGDVDILMIPVGGVYTINYKEAVNIISQIEPKIVIPMHYKIKDLKVDIEGPDKFLKEIGLTPEKTDKLKIAKKTLPVEEMKLILFQ
ncbi:MAG: MBL fold metallo-hydrolase [Candidatus Taylorbacteria bacterium]|nr:MBL fold metallo-hydrolase [Candidatus Taylorbacteria bacterium]